MYTYTVLLYKGCVILFSPFLFKTLKYLHIYFEYDFKHIASIGDISLVLGKILGYQNYIETPFCLKIHCIKYFLKRYPIPVSLALLGAGVPILFKYIPILSLDWSWIWVIPKLRKKHKSLNAYWVIAGLKLLKRMKGM